MDALRLVRAKVFIDEQGISRDEEWDGQDADAAHFLATTSTGNAVGTARLLPTGQIGRMAVLPEYRRTGIGRLLLEAAVAAAQHTGKDSVFLHAQRSAEAFYLASGFVAKGDEFHEAGIAHINMERALPIAYVAPEIPSVSGSRPAQLKNSTNTPSSVRTLRGESEFRVVSTEAAAAAHRQLRIRSMLLDPTLYDTDAFTAIVSALARRHAQTFVRILISDPSLIVNDGHRLVTLARRLPTKIHIRRPREAVVEGRSEEPAYLIADEAAIVVQPKTGTYVGFVDLAGTALARSHCLEFDTAWERAVEIPDLRLLGI